MKTVFLAIAALAVSSPALAADPTSFTFKSTNGPVTMLGGAGTWQGASYGGTSWTTWSDGKKTTSTFTCVSTSNAPNDHIFATTTVCDAKGAEGNFTMIWGCNPMDKDMKSMGCAGAFEGQTGMYAGRRGGGTFMGDMNGGWGTGQWGG